ncbi:hypothetical protein F5148DRAFT_1203270, partial [Russula earlei]
VAMVTRSLPLQVVAAHVDEGVCMGRDVMEGEVLCSVVLVFAASPVTMAWWQGLMFFLWGGVVTSALLRQWGALHFPVIYAFFLSGARWHNS